MATYQDAYDFQGNGEWRLFSSSVQISLQMLCYTNGPKFALCVDVFGKDEMQGEIPVQYASRLTLVAHSKTSNPWERIVKDTIEIVYGLFVSQFR